ncbi:hypothetical protein AAG747_13715 [Rapidithrix thailandica]|uniref:Uncharacterized protein n=1 Tax=Rapidithrix thailandica TaxID=413964 RepID=A0AAW9SB36_9BACT
MKISFTLLFFMMWNQLAMGQTTNVTSNIYHKPHQSSSLFPGSTIETSSEINFYDRELLKNREAEVDLALTVNSTDHDVTLSMYANQEMEITLRLITPDQQVVFEQLCKVCQEPLTLKIPYQAHDLSKLQILSSKQQHLETFTIEKQATGILVRR